jgi:hypothetical protein
MQHPLAIRAAALKGRRTDRPRRRGLGWHWSGRAKPMKSFTAWFYRSFFIARFFIARFFIARFP